jgi:hypothetical protein
MQAGPGETDIWMLSVRQYWEEGLNDNTRKWVRKVKRLNSWDLHHTDVQNLGRWEENN